MYVDNEPYAYLELEDTINPQLFNVWENERFEINPSQEVKFKFEKYGKKRLDSTGNLFGGWARQAPFIDGKGKSTGREPEKRYPFLGK